MPHYDTTALLASIRRRAMLPASGDALDNDDLLELATQELQTYIVPLLLSVSEEYLVVSSEVPIVAGQDSYPIPGAAVAGMLRDVQLQVSGRFHPLERIEPERAGWYAGSGDPVGFYLEGNSVVLLPSPDAAGTLRFVYHRRPSDLVAASEAGRVSSVDYSTGQVTGTNLTVAGTGNVVLDLVKATPNFDVLAEGAPAVESGGSLTFAPSAVAQLQKGDYVCRPGTSPVPQVPVELHPLLAQRTSFVAVEALGDPRSPAHEAKAERMKREAITLLSPRSRGAGRVIINPNAPGVRRSRGFAFRRF